MKRKLSKRELCLVVALLVFVVLSVILLSILLVRTYKKPKESDVCLTKDCTVTASHLISAMDTTFEPCKDFYHFMCNGFIKNHPLPDGKISESTFSSYQARLDNQLRELLEHTDPTKQPDVVFKMQEAYHVCINISYTKDEEYAKFKTFVQDVLGGWPLGNSKKNESFSLEDYLGNVRRLGIVQKLDKFKITFHKDVNDTSKQLLLFSAESWTRLPAVPSFSNDHNESDFSEIKKRISNMASLFNVTDSSVLNVVSRDIIDAIGAIEKVPLTFEDVMGYMFVMKKVTFEELNALTGNHIDWLRIANTMLKNVHTYHKNDTVGVSNVNYLASMAAALRSLSNRALGNYFVWETLNYLVDFAGPKVERILENDEDVVQGNTRWSGCVQWIQRSFPLVLTRLFVNAHVDKSGKEVVDQMVQLIQRVYRDTIQKSNWLDEESRTAALKKAENLKRMVAYPDAIFDDKWIENEYSYITQIKSLHFENVIQIAQNRTKNNLRYVREYWDPNNWSNTGHPLMINAFLMPNTNTMWLPTGILQLPFFDVNRIMSVNFALLGTVIGHEIGHSFDKTGFRFDDQGTMKPCWTDAAFAKYDQKTKCFVEQYKKYCPEELRTDDEDFLICTNATASLGDNIADNIGAKAAYTAYRLWSEENPGKEKRLPGLEEFSVNQLFFMGFAYMWCENVPPENWLQMYGGPFSSHASGRYRALGTLSNFPEFAEAFNCPVGPMNRGKDRCTLW